jgi:phosphopantothenoylcysteine decarboxylase/phosphopantothenate--cysteine ligase
MKVVVTTGPSYEPVDEVRRLTNFSTGELGVILAGKLVATGLDVICLKGTGATYPHNPTGADVRTFTTNEDLFEQLTGLSRSQSVGAVFHVAALCDYKVKQVEGADGSRGQSAKIDSRGGPLTIVLEPARKIIGEMRRLFPDALLVGWKYELNGGRTEALEKAWRQLRENGTDACVLNGRAWGSGFAFCTLPSSIRELAGKSEVVEFLAQWLGQRLSVPAR